MVRIFAAPGCSERNFGISLPPPARSSAIFVVRVSHFWITAFRRPPRGLHLIRFPLRCAAPARAAGQRAEAIWMGHSCVISASDLVDGAHARFCPFPPYFLLRICSSSGAAGTLCCLQAASFNLPFPPPAPLVLDGAGVPSGTGFDMGDEKRVETLRVLGWVGDFTGGCCGLPTATVRTRCSTAVNLRLAGPVRLGCDGDPATSYAYVIAFCSMVL